MAADMELNRWAHTRHLFGLSNLDGDSLLSPTQGSQKGVWCEPTGTYREVCGLLKDGL